MEGNPTQGQQRQNNLFSTERNFTEWKSNFHGPAVGSLIQKSKEWQDTTIAIKVQTKELYVKFKKEKNDIMKWVLPSRHTITAMKLSKQTWLSTLEPSPESFSLSGVQSDVPLDSDQPQPGNIQTAYSRISWYLQTAVSINPNVQSSKRNGVRLSALIPHYTYLNHTFYQIVSLPYSPFCSPFCSKLHADF